MQDITYFILPPDKEWFTIPDVIKYLQKELELKIKYDYKTRHNIEQKLRRELKDCEKRADSERKTMYSRTTLQHVLNEPSMYGYLIKLTNERLQQEFEEFKEKASEYAHAYKAMLANDSYIKLLEEIRQDVEKTNRYQYEMNKMINDDIYKYKIDAMIDFFCKITGFKEKLLEQDICSSYTADEQNLTLQDAAASKRSKDFYSYYDKSIVERIKQLLNK